MRTLFLCLLFVAACAGRLFSQYVPGQSYFGANNYIEYRAGNSPVIIAVPHGGMLQPSDIPDRACTDCVTVRDANTIELATALQQEILQTWGCEPHVIICHLHRRKLDANREIVEGAQGIPAAEQAWNEYQNFIQTAKDAILGQQNRGILIDLHGHGHTIQRLELGYLLSGSQLRLTDAQLATPTYTDQASIRNLVNNNPNNYNLSELLRGTYALGTLLRLGGYPSVPSDNDPAPAVGDSYFSGGYTTDFFGSVSTGALDAIQIECNFTGVRDNAANREQFAGVLADALETYLLQHYFTTAIPCGLVLALPELSSFTAQCRENRVEVAWTTTSEKEVASYQVEKSADGTHWISSAAVVPENKVEGARYQVSVSGNDLDLVRLLTTALNGDRQYSPIVEVDCAPASFTIYPNPATDRVFVNGREEVLYLYDCMGTFIRQMDPEKNGEEISLEDLPNGVYFVGGKGIAGSDMQRIIKMQ